jgi:hypothetical protein
MVGSLMVSVEPACVAELQELGFTEPQIEKLIALRSQYPFLEWVDTDRQWQRLLFLKWRYNNGDLRRG